MSWLSSGFGGALGSVAPLLSFIPGVGPILGAGAAAVGGLVQGQQAQHQADMARQQQAGFLNYYQNLINQNLGAAQNPYPAAGQYDPYSPILNEARTGAYRDATAKGLQSDLASIDYYLRPQGGVRSSAMDYAKAAAVRDATAQNAAFARNLQIQGGIERYNNAMRTSDESFRRVSALLGMGLGLGNQYQSAYQNAQGEANSIYGGLANAVKDVATLGGLGGGPRGGKTGAGRGDNTMNTAGNGIGGAIGNAVGGVFTPGMTFPTVNVPATDGRTPPLW